MFLKCARQILRSSSSKGDAKRGALALLAPGLEGFRTFRSCIKRLPNPSRKPSRHILSSVTRLNEELFGPIRGGCCEVLFRLALCPQTMNAPAFLDI